MNRFGPQDGLHICIMSKGYAERHTRNAYNVPDHVGLGWTPYTIVIQSYGCVAHTAFHSVRDLKRWLGRNYKVKLNSPWNASGMRAGRIVACWQNIDRL